MFLKEEKVSYKVIYTGQKNKLLNNGNVYHVISKDEHAWHTTLHLEEIPNAEFNDVDFIRVVENNGILKTVKNEVPSVGTRFLAFTGECDSTGEPVVLTSSKVMYILPQNLREKLSRKVRVVTEHSLPKGGSAKIYTLKY